MSLRASRPEVNAAEDDENALRTSLPAPNPDSSPRDVVGRRCAQSRRTCSSSRHREPSGSNGSRASRATSEDPTAAGFRPTLATPCGRKRASGRRQFRCPCQKKTSTAEYSTFDNTPRERRPTLTRHERAPTSQTAIGTSRAREVRDACAIAVRSEGSTGGVCVGSPSTIARPETIPPGGGA